jgi:hypothetical protein
MPQDYLTERDVQNYGSELVDFSLRAATHAVAPQLQQLGQQSQELMQRLARETKARLDREVEAAVPDYLTIDRDPRWHQWLRATDPLNGRMRQELLNDAIAAGSSTRVIAIFKGFQREAGQPAAEPAWGWEPGQLLERTRPRAMPQGRIFSRDEVKRLYELHRKGKFVGREDEWNRLEWEIIRAGAQGRILGGLEPQGK